MVHKEKAVIDRIVDGEKAVLLVGDEEQELIVDIEKIPNQAEEGTWLNMQEDGTMTIDEPLTCSTQQRVANKLELLKKRSQGSKFRK